MGTTEVQRSKEYLELRDRLYKAYFYSYLKIKIEGGKLSRGQKGRRAKALKKALAIKLSPIKLKWDELTLAEYGVKYDLQGLITVAFKNAGKACLASNNKEALLVECEEQLKEVMPKPKRKRITAIKVTR